MTEFKPKGKDIIRQEVVEDLRGDDEDFNEEENSEKIERITSRRLKDEEFKASLHKQKLKKSEDLKKTKEFYEKGGKHKSADKETQKGKISTEDKAYLYAKGQSRTAVRYLQKVMISTGKAWNKALGDNLFITWKKENDALITRRNSALGASRGGSGGKNLTDHQKIVKKFTEALPKEYKK